MSICARIKPLTSYLRHSEHHKRVSSSSFYCEGDTPSSVKVFRTRMLHGHGSACADGLRCGTRTYLPRPLLWKAQTLLSLPGGAGGFHCVCASEVQGCLVLLHVSDIETQGGLDMLEWSHAQSEMKERQILVNLGETFDILRPYEHVILLVPVSQMMRIFYNYSTQFLFH